LKVSVDPQTSFKKRGRRWISEEMERMKDQNQVAGLNVRSLRTAIVLTVCVLALALSAIAQTPAAGTKIGNQASATYTDASNTSRTATSNSVFTVVQQVASLTLTANGSKTGAPGTQVAYPHTLTNTGNGTDSFNLAVAAGTGFAHTGIAIYADANGDGIPDNSTNLTGTSVSIAAGAANAFKFVVVGSVPGTATAGQTGTLVVTATSVFTGTVTASNTDTTTVSGNAVITATKSISQNSGLAGSGPYTVTLTYTNNGNATGSTVKFTDVLPAGMTYATGTGLWSGSGATPLTDAAGGDGANIDYNVTGGTINATITSVAPGVSGTISFQVNIATPLAPQVLNNFASFSYNDNNGTGSTINGLTNTVPFTVKQSAAVTIKDTGTTGTGDSDNTANDTQDVAAAVQGGTVTFTNIITNNGNGSDIFNVVVTSNSFPAGTTFSIFKSDGVTPLVDTNSDGIPDSGPLNAGATYNVIVKATLPANSTGGPFTALITATSTAVGVVNAGVSDTVTEKLDAITANSVDLTNNAPTGTGVPGKGAGPEASAQVTNTVNPGSTTTLALYVNNTSTVSDSFDLVASSNTTFGSGNTVPAGWTVTFRTSTGTDCTTLGGAITNSGVINAAGNKLVCAVVSVPAGYAAGTNELYFQSKSPTSGAFDQLHDAITVNVLRAVTMTPNQSGQVFPNGSVTYVHTISNNGNVTESITFVNPITSDNLTAWSSVMYQDNGTTAGSVDAGDSAVINTTTFTLAPGAKATMFVKVGAPAGAPIGAIDTTTATVKFTYLASTLSTTAQDSTTVIAGELRLLKEQALDATCSGTPGTYGQADIGAGAIPGACVFYRITATNQGTADVTSVVISDATPAYTVYVEPTVGSAANSSITGAGVTLSKPAAGVAGTISVNLGTTQLAPGQSEVLTFVVKINP
jgi:trimeric autotransporter adhesin